MIVNGDKLMQMLQWKHMRVIQLLLAGHLELVGSSNASVFSMNISLSFLVAMD